MRTSIVSMGLALGLMGCHALSEPAPDVGSKDIIPIDTRAAVNALLEAPPITGGTLAIDPSDTFAVAADPARDRVSVVNLQSGDVRHVELEIGSEPGRVAIDGHGRAHVALRRTGQVATIGLEDATMQAVEDVCRVPRGVTHDGSREQLHVACAEGQLVTLSTSDPTSAPTPVTELDLPNDVRDVVRRPDGTLVVSRFKSAELLALDADGAMLARNAPVSPRVPHFAPRADGSTEFSERTLAPHVAWRTVNADASWARENSTIMVHQGALEDEIDIGGGEEDDDGQGSGGGAGPAQSQGSSYGGGGTCDQVVQTELTMFDSELRVRTMPVMGVVLPVDVAVAPSGNAAAIVQAGLRDPDAPRPFTVFREGAVSAPPDAFVRGSVAMVSLANMQHATPESASCEFPTFLDIPGQATAAAFTRTGTLVVQTREPASLALVVDSNIGLNVNRTIDLGGDSVANTGHDIFHRDSGAGVACASCHAEGGDDGHVWRFSTIGARRTQAVNIGLEGTAPFHWDGDMPHLGVLMSEVFVGRMGGVHQSEDRLSSLGNWVFSMTPPPSMLAPDADGAAHGKQLFESSEAGCTSCHAGDKLTDNKSYAVGTTDGEHALQVPSLRAIGYRAPFIHDGCAETLEQRFDPACGGGDKHGKTSHLSESDVRDLVTYLKTL